MNERCRQIASCNRLPIRHDIRWHELSVVSTQWRRNRGFKRFSEPGPPSSWGPRVRPQKIQEVCRTATKITENITSFEFIVFANIVWTDSAPYLCSLQTTAVNISEFVNSICTSEGSCWFRFSWGANLTTFVKQLRAQLQNGALQGHAHSDQETYFWRTHKWLSIGNSSR